MSPLMLSDASTTYCERVMMLVFIILCEHNINSFFMVKNAFYIFVYMFPLNKHLIFIYTRIVET